MLACTAKVRVLGSQLFRAAGNTETGFANSSCLALIYQIVCMARLAGVPPLSVSPSECLFGRFQLDFGFCLKI